jgi:hypothetical protein
MRGKYTQKNMFRREFEAARDRLASLGGSVEPGVNDYEAFTYSAPGVRLIFYPHKTSAGNHHIRVRAGGKCEPKKLRAAIFALAENSCTFQFPADPSLHREAVSAALQRQIAQRHNVGIERPGTGPLE